jgi:hypothetical protein
LLYDPKKGALTRRGLAAQTVGEDFDSEWQTTVSRIESDLSTPEQRLAFRARAGTLGEAARRQVMSHQDGELRAADEQSFKALTATTLEAVQRSGAAGDDAAATALLREQEARLVSYAARNGWTPEARDAALVAQRSSTRMAQIGAMVEAGNAEGATALLAKYSADLTVDDKAKIAGPIQEAMERRAVVSAADAILKAYEANPDAGTEAMLRDVPLALRSDVRRYVNGELDARDKEKRARVGAMLLEDATAVEQARGRPARLVIAPTRWAQYSLEQKAALTRLSDSLADGGEQKQNSGAWLAFWSMDPKDIAKMPRDEFITKYWSKFDRSRQDRAERMYADATRAPNSTAASGLLSTKDRLQRTYREMFDEDMDPKQWDAEQFDAYEQAVDTEVMAWSAVHDGKMPDDKTMGEMMVAVGSRMTAATVQTAPKDAKGMAAFMAQMQRNPFMPPEMIALRGGAGSDTAYVPIAKMPPVSRDSIVKRLTENGKAATPARVERAYMAAVSGDTVAFDREVGSPLDPTILRAVTMPFGFPATRPRQ